jgi:hypothetical protein
MSLEKHPNFNSIKFVVDILSSYYNCLRGKADKTNPPLISEEILKFVLRVEEIIDEDVKLTNPKGKFTV